MSTQINNYHSTGFKYQPTIQIQPTKHKSKRFQQKISRSNDKLIIGKIEPKNYSSISKTNNPTPIKNTQNTTRKGLKIQLDNRLNKVYSHIVKYRSISLRPTNNLSGLEIVNLQKSQLQGNEPNKLQNEPTINGELPYQLLRAYVQSIYEDYHIKDPLQALGNEFTINLNPMTQSQFDNKNYTDKKTQRMTVISTPQKNYNIASQQKDRLSTKKKILQLKRHFINELSMTEQTTQKKQPSKLNTVTKIKTQTGLNNRVTFDLPKREKQPLHKNEQIDYNSNSKLAQTKFTTVSNNNYLRSYQSVNLRSQSYGNPTIANSRVQHYPFQGQNRFNPQQRKISQTFRYCFVCEQPVLETNIKYHEKQCSGLRDLLDDQNLSKQKLLYLIENKIQKVQQQLQSSFHQIQTQNLNQKFAQIKDCTKKLISSHKHQNLQSSKHDLFSSEAKINSLIHNTNVLKTLELINKLKWFIHLKNNFIKISK